MMIEYLTAVLVIVTTVYVVLTHRIWKENARLVSLTREQIELVNRTILLQRDTLKETRAANQLQAYKNAVDEIVSIKNHLVQHQGLMKALTSTPFVTGFKLVPPDHPENLLLICQCFFSFEHIYRMRREELISEDEWAGLSCEIALLLDVPQFQSVWGVVRKLNLHTSSFRNAVNMHYEQEPRPQCLVDPKNPSGPMPNPPLQATGSAGG